MFSRILRHKRRFRSAPHPGTLSELQASMGGQQKSSGKEPRSYEIVRRLLGTHLRYVVAPLHRKCFSETAGVIARLEFLWERFANAGSCATASSRSRWVVGFPRIGVLLLKCNFLMVISASHKSGLQVIPPQCAIEKAYLFSRTSLRPITRRVISSFLDMARRSNLRRGQVCSRSCLRVLSNKACFRR